MGAHLARHPLGHTVKPQQPNQRLASHRCGYAQVPETAGPEDVLEMTISDVKLPA